MRSQIAHAKPMHSTESASMSGKGN